MTQTPHGRAHPRVRGSGDGAGGRGASGGRRRRRRRRAVAIFAIDRLVRSVAALGLVVVVIVVVLVVVVDITMLTDVVVVLAIEEKRATGGWPPRATDCRGLCRRGDGHRGTAGCRRFATIAGAPASPAFISGGRSVPLLLAVAFTAGERLRGPQALHFLEPGPIHFGTFGAPVLDASRRFRFRWLAASTERCGLNLGRVCVMRVCAPTTVEC